MKKYKILIFAQNMKMKISKSKMKVSIFCGVYTHLPFIWGKRFTDFLPLEKYDTP